MIKSMLEKLIIQKIIHNIVYSGIIIYIFFNKETIAI